MAAPAPALAEPPISRLLGRLDAVRQTAPDRWQATCPAHEDRRPSLPLRELPDGRVLVHCWAGCAVGDVLAAVGLRLADLFPERLDHHRAPLPRGRRWIPAEAITALVHEVIVTQLAAEDLARGETLDAARRERLHEAASRLSAAAQEVGA